MPATARWIETEAEKQEVEGIVSLLQYKIRKGVATPEERAEYRRGIEDLAIYDWGTESYQNYVPNQWAAMAERQQAQRKAERALIAPAPSKRLPKDRQPRQPETPATSSLPPLPKRGGKFATG